MARLGRAPTQYLIKSSESVKKVGENLRRVRQSKELTVEQLARRIGIHPTSVRRYERGEANISLITLEKFARALGCTIEDLTRST